MFKFRENKIIPPNQSWLVLRPKRILQNLHQTPQRNILQLRRVDAHHKLLILTSNLHIVGVKQTQWPQGHETVLYF